MQLSRCILGAAVVALIVSTAHSRAEETGSVSGRILTVDGAPAVNFQLRVEQAEPMGADPRATVRGNDAVGLQRIRVVARAATNQNGEFHFQNLKPGTYTLVGGSRAVGWVFFEFEIQANKDTKLGDIQLVRLH